jgi:hypothetical protein
VCSRMALVCSSSSACSVVFLSQLLSLISSAAKSVEIEAELELQKQGLIREVDKEAHKAALAAKALEDKGCVLIFLVLCACVPCVLP